VSFLKILKILLLGPFALLFVSTEKRELKKALKEVAKLKDQTKLMEIAKTTQHSSVRSAAIEKITDHALILELAKSLRFSSELKTSIANIADQKILLDIAKNAKYNEMRIFAVENLTNMEDMTGIDEQELIILIHSLESIITDSKFWTLPVKKLFSMICTPSVLLDSNRQGPFFQMLIRWRNTQEGQTDWSQ
jgi:hypothetical protein